MFLLFLWLFHRGLPTPLVDQWLCARLHARLPPHRPLSSYDNPPQSRRNRHPAVTSRHPRVAFPLALALKISALMCEKCHVRPAHRGTLGRVLIGQCWGREYCIATDTILQRNFRILCNALIGTVPAAVPVPVAVPVAA